MDFLASAQSNLDILIGGTQYKDPDNPGQDRFALTIVELAKRVRHSIEMSFLPHGIAVDPTDPNRMVVTEKIGPGGALVDIGALRQLAELPIAPGRKFYGHCAYSSDGKLVYTVETANDTGKGWIVVRDAETLAEIDTFPSFGEAPHECILIDGGKTMVITNGGGRPDGDVPCVAYIDVATRSLVRREVLTNRTLNTGHLAIAPDGSLIVVSAPRLGVDSTLGGVSIQPSGKSMKSITSPKKVVGAMNGEALSVAVNGDVAVVTHPGGDMLTFWSLGQRRLLKKIDIRFPRGVTLNRRKDRFIATFGDDASLAEIDAATLEVMPEHVMPKSMVTGSHLYNWTDIVRNLD